MPHIVQLDLSDVSSHGHDVEGAASASARHWLLGAIYGRDLLKAKLRQVRPDLKVKFWANQHEFDHLLEQMVDVLDLREWPQPKGPAARLRYLGLVLRMLMAVDAEQPLPEWRQQGA